MRRAGGCAARRGGELWRGQGAWPPSWLGLHARPPGALPARRTHAGGRGGGSSLTDASGAAVSLPPPPGRPLQLPRSPSARGARVAPRGQVSVAMRRAWALGRPLRTSGVGLGSPWSLGGACRGRGLPRQPGTWNPSRDAWPGAWAGMRDARGLSEKGRTLSCTRDQAPWSPALGSCPCRGAVTVQRLVRVCVREAL